jgi:hypothetical protein
MPTKDRRRGAGRAAPRRRSFQAGRILGLAVVALLVGVLLTGGVGGGSGGSGSRSEGARGDGRSASSDDSGSESGSGSGSHAGSTVVPPDIDEDRQPVDIAVVPSGEEPDEVARWWASTYTAYIGAETPPQLGARLAPLTTDEMRAQVEAVPLAASYDDGPVPIAGASSWSSPTPREDGSRQFRIAVETEDALVIYVLTLVDGGGGAGWRVAKADRL